MRGKQRTATLTRAALIPARKQIVRVAVLEDGRSLKRAAIVGARGEVGG